MEENRKMKKIAVTGANGYIASLVQLYNRDKFEFIRVSRKDVNYEDMDSVRNFFNNLDFDILFHTAANATTADCENNPELTHKINTEATIEIAKICKAKNKRLIFMSTEQCFNGKTEEGPFNEESELVSVTNYGKQKAEADKWIRENLDDYVILRLSWMMGLPLPNVKTSPNIIKNTLNAIRNKQETLFTVNEVRGMTYAGRLAEQFKAITELESGVYHFSNVNKMNTYEASKYVARVFGYDEETIDKYIKPNTERYADRFRDYRLDNTKIKNAGIKLYTFEEDVEACLKDFGWL